MTINDIRNDYPSAMFYFFDLEGWSVMRTPFLHEKVSRFSYDEKHNSVYIYLES